VLLVPEKPTYAISTVNNTRVLRSKGPWPTKSNGQLNVLFSIGFTNLNEKFFHYEESELDKISPDIRGMRAYSVESLQNKAIGANEWHRIRNELVFVIKGSVKWTCEDVSGHRSDVILDHTSGIWVPPFILHTYEALEDDTQIQVIASTLFLPGDPTTHDTYSALDFTKLQKKYQTK
jgi:hypothetical protein